MTPAVFDRLCSDVSQRGQFVELIASKVTRKRRNGDRVETWKHIEELRITDRVGNIIAREPMKGLADLERAASVII